MSCTRIRRLIGVYRGLDRAERRMLATHLRGCEQCRSTWSAEQDLLRRVRAIPELDPPAGFEGRLLNIPALVSTQPRTWLLPRLLPLVLLALGGLLALDGRGLPVHLIASGNAGAGAGAQASLGAAVDSAEAVSVSGEAGASRPAHALGLPVARLGRITLLTPQPEQKPLPPVVPAGRGATRSAFGQSFTGISGKPESSDLKANGIPEDTDAPSAETNSNRSRNQDAGKNPTEPPPPTTSPAPSQVALACVDLTLQVFSDCPDCDGALPPGLALPLPSVLYYDVYDSRQAALLEGLLEPDGKSRIEQRLESLCGSLPLTVQLRFTDPDWRSCPTGDSLRRLVTSDGVHSLEFGLTRGCPAPTEPPPTAGTETPEPPPSATPGAVGPTAQSTGVAAGETPAPPSTEPAEPTLPPSPQPTLAPPPLEPSPEALVERQRR